MRTIKKVDNYDYEKRFRRHCLKKKKKKKKKKRENPRNRYQNISEEGKQKRESSW